MAFSLEIADQMVELFGISKREALARVNRHWRGQDLSQENDIVFHEDRDFWAKTIYYGGESFWWLNPPGLKPKEPPPLTDE